MDKRLVSSNFTKQTFNFYMTSKLTNHLLLALFTIIFSASAFAIEVKLLCKMEMAKSYRGGQFERDRITEIIEVTEIGEYISIIPQSDSLSSVSTSKNHNTISISNFSDKNKWHIIASRTNRNGGTYITQVSIDRNSGIILYSHDWEGGTIFEKGSGDCEKISQERRKF